MAVAIACALVVIPVDAQDPLDPVSYRFEALGGKFDQPLYVTHAGDGSSRLFVVEQAGQIWIIFPDGSTSTEPFLDIGFLITDDTFRGGYTERGLLGLAFHPNYAVNGQFYVYYFDRDMHTVLARLRVSADDPNRADLQSVEVLLRVKQPYTDHNGGMILFGPDGYLYLGIGDGGGTQGDPERNGQSLQTYLGKILRLDVNRTQSDKPYAIPADNPFVNHPDALPEIWAYGLRNPWRFSFDRETGDLFIGDVGWATAEEINYVPAGTESGLNFGWNIFEGTERTLVRKDDPAPVPVMMPIATYDHTQGCSVTGGYVYRGFELQSLRGVYLYGDYCNGNLWLAQRTFDGRWEVRLWKNTLRQIASFGEDERGEFYLVDYKGFILKLVRS